MNSPAAVLRDVDVILGIDSDTVRLVKFTREAAGAAKARHDLARLPVDDFHLRIILIDHEDELLVGVVREIQRHSGAAALLESERRKIQRF